MVTKAILGLNLVVFLLTSGQSLAGSGQRGDLAQRLALFGPAIARGEWYRLVTSGFVHYGIIHIAFNMLLLHRFGSMLEERLGRTRFAALFLASLLAGSFGALATSPYALTAGASGAVFGLVGATAVGMRRHGIDLWHSDVGGLLAVNLVLTFVIPGISVGGHLGGLAGGALVGWSMIGPQRSAQSTVPGVVVAMVVTVAAFAGALARVQSLTG